MSDCGAFEEKISALIDGELSEKEEAELFEHMAQCQSCRDTFAAFAEISSAMCDDEEPPEDLHGRIMTAVKNEEHPAKKTRSPLLSLLYTAAIVALVLLCGLPLNHLGGDIGGGELSDASFATQNGATFVGDDTFQGTAVNTEYKTVALSADELTTLLAPADSLIEPDFGDGETEDTEITIYVVNDNDAEYMCTVTVAGNRVYADFGDGIYLASCTPDDIIILFQLAE